jgi:hypothetical protein
MASNMLLSSQREEYHYTGGFKIVFRTFPQLSPEPVEFPPPRQAKDIELLVEEAQVMLLKGAVTICNDHSSTWDDWLLVDTSKEALTYKSKLLHNLYEDLCLILNTSESDLIPSQKFEFLSYCYDLTECLYARGYRHFYGTREDVQPTDNQ